MYRKILLGKAAGTPNVQSSTRSRFTYFTGTDSKWFKGVCLVPHHVIRIQFQHLSAWSHTECETCQNSSAGVLFGQNFWERLDYERIKYQTVVRSVPGETTLTRLVLVVGDCESTFSVQYIWCSVRVQSFAVMSPVVSLRWEFSPHAGQNVSRCPSPRRRSRQPEGMIQWRSCIIERNISDPLRNARKDAEDFTC